MAIFLLSFITFILLSTFLPFSSSSLPPSTTIYTATQILRRNGYSLFATALESSASSNSTPHWNFTGTLFAPPDSAFFSSRRFKSGYRRRLLRPTSHLLVYHTLHQPLRFENLSSFQNGSPFQTLYRSRCLFLSRSPNGEIHLSTNKRLIWSHVRIHQPNLYSDDHLTVHGIDGVLDHLSASRCPRRKPTDVEDLATLSSIPYLERAVHSLRLIGYSVVATAMWIRRSELTPLRSVTVLAPTDENLLAGSDDFRYDLRYHVLPDQILSLDLANLSQGTRIDTLVPGRTVVVGSSNGAVTINGVVIDRPEVYRNEWISVIPITRPLRMSDEVDDVSDHVNQDSGEIPAGVSDSGGFLDRTALSPKAAEFRVYSNGGIHSSGNISLPPTTGDLPPTNGDLPPTTGDLCVYGLNSGCYNGENSSLSTLSNNVYGNLTGISADSPSPSAMMSDLGSFVPAPSPEVQECGDAGCSAGVGAPLAFGSYHGDVAPVISTLQPEVAGGSSPSPN
ncbi:fasciclin-like arabinogalactan protein 21 [Tasmannia lanceolata]|uniref:fasciclin-like arabinogalactan protein 21 n=1 Tax=Tasmannia lanceolata TaxID=3420 RepID=UPI00406285D2